eukprot:364298-Chlamydomonas_euryale.AAC.15
MGGNQTAAGNQMVGGFQMHSRPVAGAWPTREETGSMDGIVSGAPRHRRVDGAGTLTTHAEECGLCRALWRLSSGASPPMDWTGRRDPRAETAYRKTAVHDGPLGPSTAPLVLDRMLSALIRRSRLPRAASRPRLTVSQSSVAPRFRSCRKRLRVTGHPTTSYVAALLGSRSAKLLLKRAYGHRCIEEEEAVRMDQRRTLPARGGGPGVAAAYGRPGGGR